MTPEYNFILKLQAFLDTEFNEVSQKRIAWLLGEYTKELPNIPQVITIEKIVYRHLRTKDISPMDIVPETIIQPMEILTLISQATGLPLSKITGKDRHVEFVVARHVAMFVIRDLCPTLTLLDIGKMFNRDHTTVIHSISHVTDMVEVGREEFIKLIGYVNFHLSQEEKATA